MSKANAHNIFWEEDMTLKTFLLGACSALAFAGMARPKR
jgi:sorbitol/mannitol transport system substrate-binding protein